MLHKSSIAPRFTPNNLSIVPSLWIDVADCDDAAGADFSQLRLSRPVKVADSLWSGVRDARGGQH
jgi:hypothetical protein